MNESELAALKRKHAATQEPAKRNELANLLKAAGHDPDAVETVSATPKGRSAPVKVTATPTRPVATTEDAPAASESNKSSKETAAKTASTSRRTGRKPKAETSKEND